MERVFQLTREQIETLTEELSEALEEMVDRTCRDMAPLWLEGTRREREWIGDAIPDLGFEPSPRYLALSKGKRSGYRGLACFRHAALWQRAADAIADPDFRRAFETLYFTPFPDNVPPYAWSSRASGAPGAGRFASATELKKFAKEGSYAALGHLRRRRREIERDGLWESEVRGRLLQTGCRDTVRDVLKLEDFPEWEAE